MYPRTGLYRSRLTPTASRSIVHLSTPDLATRRLVRAISKEGKMGHDEYENAYIFRAKYCCEDVSLFA